MKEFNSGHKDIEEIYESEILKNLPKTNFIRYLLDLGFYECNSAATYSGIEKVAKNIDENIKGLVDLKKHH